MWMIVYPFVNVVQFQTACSPDLLSVAIKLIALTHPLEQ